MMSCFCHPGACMRARSFARLVLTSSVHALPHHLSQEMGLGKTIQSIAFLANLKDQEGVDGKHLIVTSASTLSNWKREFDTWFPSCKSLCYTGSQKERGVLRDKIRYNPDTYDVIITTYSMFQGEAGKLDRKFLNRIDFKVVCTLCPRHSRLDYPPLTLINHLSASCTRPNPNSHSIHLGVIFEGRKRNGSAHRTSRASQPSAV